MLTSRPDGRSSNPGCRNRQISGVVQAYESCHKTVDVVPILAEGDQRNRGDTRIPRILHGQLLSLMCAPALGSAFYHHLPPGVSQHYISNGGDGGIKTRPPAGTMAEVDSVAHSKLDHQQRTAQGSAHLLCSG